MIYPSNVRFAQTPMLNIGYEEHGDASGFPIMLLNGNLNAPNVAGKPVEEHDGQA